MNFRIATFNVENLILPGIRYYDRLELLAGDYEAKANWIASIFDRAKAEIVGLQEVWLEEAIRNAAGRSAYFANGAHICAPGASAGENVVGTTARRPRLGLISRFPIKSAQTVLNFPPSVDLSIPIRTGEGKINSVPIGITQFQRPILRTVVDVDGRDILVFVAHLKSKGPMIASGEDGDDPFVATLGLARATIVRAAEAAALRHLILADVRKTRTPAIVLGDLNDTPDSASTQIVRGPSPYRSLRRTEQIALWDVILYSTFRIASERAGSLHTHIFDGERDILDHILVSEEFYPRNRGRIGEVVRHVVINDHLRDSNDHPKPEGASDHGIPVAEIHLFGHLQTQRLELPSPPGLA